MTTRVIDRIAARAEANEHRDILPDYLMEANTQRLKTQLWYVEDGTDMPMPMQLTMEINHGQPFSQAARAVYKVRAIQQFQGEKAKRIEDQFGHQPGTINANLVRVFRDAATLQHIPAPPPAAGAPGHNGHQCFFLWEVFAALAPPAGQQPLPAILGAVVVQPANPPVEERQVHQRRLRGCVRRGIGLMNNYVGRANRARASAVLWAREAGDGFDPIYNFSYQRIYITARGGQHVLDDIPVAVTRFLARKQAMHLGLVPEGGLQLPPTDVLPGGAPLPAPVWP